MYVHKGLTMLSIDINRIQCIDVDVDKPVLSILGIVLSLSILGIVLH